MDERNFKIQYQKYRDAEVKRFAEALPSENYQKCFAKAAVTESLGMHQQTADSRTIRLFPSLRRSQKRRQPFRLFQRSFGEWPSIASFAGIPLCDPAYP